MTQSWWPCDEAQDFHANQICIDGSKQDGHPETSSSLDVSKPHSVEDSQACSACRPQVGWRPTQAQTSAELRPQLEASQGSPWNSNEAKGSKARKETQSSRKNDFSLRTMSLARSRSAATRKLNPAQFPKTLTCQCNAHGELLLGSPVECGRTLHPHGAA